MIWTIGIILAAGYAYCMFRVAYLIVLKHTQAKRRERRYAAPGQAPPRPYIPSWWEIGLGLILAPLVLLITPFIQEGDIYDGIVTVISLPRRLWDGIRYKLRALLDLMQLIGLVLIALAEKVAGRSS